MKLINITLSFLLFIAVFNVSAEVKIPSEEEKNKLTVYLIKNPTDDPIFSTDIDGNLIFSKSSSGLKDGTIESNACLLINLSEIGGYDKLASIYGLAPYKDIISEQGITSSYPLMFSDDAHLYLVDDIYKSYGIENVAKILSEDSEKDIEVFATTSGLNLKVNTKCKNTKNSNKTDLGLKPDLYFIPTYIYERFLELGDKSAQGITEADVLGSWQFDQMKALSDNYSLVLNEENKVKNELQEKFLRLANEKSKEYMGSLFLVADNSYNSQQRFCTLNYSGDDAVAAIGYRLMGDQMLIDDTVLNYFEKEKITLNFNEDQKIFHHGFDDINTAFISIKEKLNSADRKYCNFFVDYPENILKLKNAIDRDFENLYTSIGKLFSKNDTGNQFAINKGFDNYEQYSFAQNIGADKRNIESLIYFKIFNQLEYKKIQDEMVEIKYSEDTSISSVLNYLNDLSEATKKTMDVLEYRTARLKEEKRSADIAREEEQKRLEEFAREYPYTATLSCGMGNGDHINIVACFVADKYGAPTELEIQNGQDYQMFKPYNLLQAGREYSSGLMIDLRSGFSLKAQNSSDMLVLTIEIVDNATGMKIYTDSAAQYGVVSYAK